MNNENTSSAINDGKEWTAEKIKEELSNILSINFNASNHEFRYDSEDKYFYIYDNECYLFIFNKKIQLRCDRDNVFSENTTLNYEIGTEKDVFESYQKFNSMTMEDEEE